MKRWFKYVKPYKKYFILGPLCMIIEVLCEIQMPGYLRMIINNSAQQPSSYSVGVMLLMVGISLLMMLGGIGGAYFGAKASVNFASDLRKDVYSKIQEFSFSNIDKFNTGSLVTRLTNDINQMQQFINMLLRMCLRSPGMLVGALIMAILLNPPLSVVLAITIPLMILSIFGLVMLAFPRFTRVQKRIDKLNNTVQENVTNVRVVKSFVRTDHETERFSKDNKDLKNTGMSAMKVMILIGPVMTLFMNITTAAVIWTGGRLLLSDTEGSMPIGDLSAFISYCTMILISLMMMTMVIVMGSRAIASAKRIYEVLDEQIDINDKDSNARNTEVQGGNIEFRNVSFRYYKTSEDKVLDNINLKINSGETIGIIGSTGSGKTTLVSMIPRLYDPDEGEVLVNGINVKDYSLVNLRDGVGMVLQKNVLFSGTIEENLRWGNENADMSEIIEAAKHSQADKFVQNFSDEYQTSIEQGGVNVSGGQKQRLCIARALLKKPKILILDDSTSAVDTATEAEIRKTFKNELSDSTKIIIAQRITSVMEADKIFVLDEGRLVGEGRHEYLLENCTEYKEIYFSQIDRRGA